MRGVSAPICFPQSPSPSKALLVEPAPPSYNELDTYTPASPDHDRELSAALALISARAQQSDEDRQAIMSSIRGLNVADAGKPGQPHT